MRLSLRDLLAVALLLLIWPENETKKIYPNRCPIGFKLAYREDSKKPTCYRLKDTPESFHDKFKDCAGNIFTIELYYSLNITRTKHVIWTDYKSSYPGGLFVDWSYTDSMGKPFEDSYDVKYDPSLGIHEELCVVVDPVSNFTAVSCSIDEKHYRYCFVRPYDDQPPVPDTDECPGLYWRIFSPISTCLKTVTRTTGLRATWEQAMDMCSKENSSLINKGWRLSNVPQLLSADRRSNNPLPLGMRFQYGKTRSLEGITSDNKYNISEAEWNFDSVIWDPDKRYTSLANDTWSLVDSSHIFFHVICEQPPNKDFDDYELELIVDGDKLKLESDYYLAEKKNIHCFTDSKSFFTSKVEIEQISINEYKMVAPSYGYYWCMHFNYNNNAETNRVLFVKNEDKVRNLYACKIIVSKNYELSRIGKLQRQWKEKLKQFIYYRTVFIKEYGDSENITEEMLTKFRNEKELEWTDPDIVDDFKIKRLFLDSKTVLLHFELSRKMKPLLPGTKITLGSRDDVLRVVSMKPAYFCKGFNSIPDTKLDETVTANCSQFTCVGDFAEGVQWVEIASEHCETTTESTTPTETTTPTESTSPTEPIERVSTFIDMGKGPMPTALPLPKMMRNISHTENSTIDSGLGSNHTTEAWGNYTTESWGNYTTESWGNYTTESWSNYTTESWGPNSTDGGWNYTLSTQWIKPTNLPDWSSITTVNTPFTDPPLEVSTVNNDITTVENDVTTVATEVPTTTRRPPQDQLQDVIGELEQLLQNDTLPLESLEQPFDQVNDILNVEDEDFEISSDLLHLLDQLANRVELGMDQRAIKVRDNVAMMMADATPDNPVRGVRVAAAALGRTAESFVNRTFDFIEGDIDTSELLSSSSEAVVYLPASVTREARRISFVAFRNQRAFQSDYTVNSRVFSVNVENLTHFERGEVIDIHLTPLVGTPERDQRRVCAYWQFDANGSGVWARDGCRLIRATRPGAMDTCRCDHLTHFAEVLIPRTVFSERNEQALEILSVIGCCISILGLIFVGLTAALFRSWRHDYSNKIWLQLCAAIFLVAICFLVAVYADFERYNVPCMLVGVLLHYSVIASFCWMLVAAVLSYRRLVLVFTRDMSHKLLRASAFAWGAPCAVVGVLLAVNPLAYAERDEELDVVRSFCYPTGLGLWLAVFAPIALILLANWTLFILIVRSVFASRRIQRHGDSNEALRCASVSCLLVFLFGLPWIVGLFASNLVMAYIFCLTANYQGFVLFVFFVVGNKKTRDLWLNKLKIKQTRKVPVTSSTYTNRSVGPGWRAGAEGASSIEAKTSKPRSLTSPDDSRFS